MENWYGSVLARAGDVLHRNDIVGALLFLGSTGHNPARFTDAWVDAFGDILVTIGLVVLLPFWLALRAFDIAFIAHHRNRRGYQ